MKEFEYTVTDPVGLHARPAGLLVRKAQSLPDAITLHHGKKSADLKKLLAVMGLGVRCGDTVTVRIEGPSEERSLAEMKQVFKETV